MAKEIFKNLPDKSTPLSASKLNGLFDGTESMGSIVVEDISCKNLWLEQNLNTNANNYNNGKYTYSSSSSKILINTDSSSKGINPCLLKTGEKITWSFEIYTPSDFTITSSYLCTSKNGSQVNNYEHNKFSVKAGTSKIYYTDTIIGDLDALGFVLYGSVPSGTTVSKIQIEKGSVATDFVEHKEIGNKQHYSTTEQVIGTYLGKTLYRIVIQINSITTTNSDLANIQYLHIDDLVTLKGTIYTNVGSKFPVPLYDSANNYSVIFISEAGVLRGRASIGSGSLSKILVTLEYTKTTD